MKEDIIYLKHILQAINRIEEYTTDFTHDDFLSNYLVQDAVIRQLEIIGEATKRISFATTENYPHIEWKDVAGMRDKLIHHYMGVDIEILWDTIRQDIPILKEEIIRIIQIYQSAEK